MSAFISIEEARKMVEAVEKAKVANTVWYNYRRIPAVSLAKQIIASGKLGKIFHYRANFLQDWTINADLPQGGDGLWRMDIEAAGSGVTGDLLTRSTGTPVLRAYAERLAAVAPTFAILGNHDFAISRDPFVDRSHLRELEPARLLSDEGGTGCRRSIPGWWRRRSRRPGAARTSAPRAGCKGG